MSDSQFRSLVRNAIASDSRLDFEAAIHFGHRIGMNSWALLNNGIPLRFLATELATERPPLQEGTFRRHDLLALGIEASSDPSYLPSRSGKYPTLEMCSSREEYWKLAKDYELLRDGTLLVDDGHPGYHFRIVNDPRIITAFVEMNHQTNIISEARKIIVEEASGNNPILKNVLAWSLEYNDGNLVEPEIIVVDGENVMFWPVGRNSSCFFMAGLVNGQGPQRYQYSSCESEEPFIRMVDNWQGYYGHF
jgi:hypothetical protein